MPRPLIQYLQYFSRTNGLLNSLTHYTMSIVCDLLKEGMELTTDTLLLSSVDFYGICTFLENLFFWQFFFIFVT